MDYIGLKNSIDKIGFKKVSKWNDHLYRKVYLNDFYVYVDLKNYETGYINLSLLFNGIEDTIKINYTLIIDSYDLLYYIESKLNEMYIKINKVV